MKNDTDNGNTVKDIEGRIWLKPDFLGVTRLLHNINHSKVEGHPMEAIAKNVSEETIALLTKDWGKA